MKKIFLSLAVFVMALCANAQTNQYFWYQGNLMLGTQIAQIDSVTFGNSESVDTLHLLLPRTIIKTVHDTVYITIHDTVCPNLIPEGALAGEFSVSATKKVRFSKGNLQFNAVQGTHQCADGTTQQGTWQFAENQWTILKTANDNASATYDGWIDLFPWGTSGYDGKYPYLTNASYDNSFFINNQQDISGTMLDWGLYNEISNGGTYGTWRTPTAEEYEYIFKLRPNAANLQKAKVTVNGVCGHMLCPDNWDTSISLSSTYSEAEWEQMEALGAVFLPDAGVKDYSLVGGTGWFFVGYYWTGTCSTTSGKAICLDTYDAGSLADVGHNEHAVSHGRSVRLVQDVE